MRFTAFMIVGLAMAAAAPSPGLAQPTSTKDIPPPIEITGTARRTDVHTLAGGDRIIQYNNPDRQDKPTAQPTPSRIRIFIPGNHGRIRAILLDLGSTFTSDNTELQAVARAEGWAVAGCLLRYKYGTELLDMALEEAAAKAERPELVNAPIFLAGFSRNGSRAWDFAEEERNHARTAGLILGGNPGIPSGMVSREGTWNEPRVALARQLPALTVVGSRDPFVDYDKGAARFWHNATYPKIRSVPDVTWGMMIGWGYGHGWEGSWTPFTVFMQDVLALRLDGPAAADGTTRMKPIRFADGWFAEYGWTTDWPEIAPVGTFTGDSSRAVWLPSADLAHVWRAYQVRHPQVAVAVDDGVLRATAPADATAVEFFDRGRSLGTVRSAPFSLPVKLQGVQTVFAVATTPSGKTPSRPVTVADGRPLDWQRGTAAETAAAAPENIVVVSAAGRATARAIVSGQPAQPAAVAALRAELEPLATSAHVEQRDAAARLLKAINAAAAQAAAQPARPNAGAVFDVRVMGAAGDGRALDGPVVQRAIDAAAAAGGGTVVLAAGTYLSGAIRMKSKVTLRLEKDAVLLAAPDAALFPPVESRWEGSQATYPAPLVVMEACTDASIVGAGTLSGNERCVLVKECKNIGFDGITFISRLRWTLHLLYSDGVVVENCRFTTDGTNTDGIDPDSSRNIVIRKCFFNTGDDCIAIKSGVNAEGVKVGRPSENITIEDCVMERGHGAVSLGSEMSGGVRNITIKGCRMSGCWAGVRIKTRRGRGGDVQNVHVSDCVISHNKVALLIDTRYKWTAGKDAIPGPEGIPLLGNFRFHDITGEGNATALVMVGMPERPIAGIHLRNITLGSGPPGSIENARDVVLESLKLDGPVRITDVTGRGLPTAVAPEAGAPPKADPP